jgi:homoaconitate hydratase
MDERLTISNMTTEWGALVGYFPVDLTTLEWYEDALHRLESRTFASPTIDAIPHPPEHPRINRRRLDALRATPLASDPGAQYSSHLIFDLSTLVPHVSGPNSVKVSTPLSILQDAHIPIQKAYLVSCTNSRVSDLAAAAAVMKGNRVADGVDFYVAAASSEVQAASEQRGDWDVLVAGGAKVLPAGCGPCIGLGVGLLKEGETGISATNRNYKGRMGDPKALAYLASPAVVAASAIKGYICSPDPFDEDVKTRAGAPKHSISHAERSSAAATEVNEVVLPGFPAKFSGPLLFAPQDNLNTDGIYPGKYTYQDDITLEKQAQIVMENYDPSFAGLVASLLRQQPTTAAPDAHEGVILVSGYNFGTGSSREQAATALKAAGVPLVLAGSFGDIFKRNAINNGLVCIEAPALLAELTNLYAKSGDHPRTVHAGLTIEVSMTDGRVVVHGMLPDGKQKVYTVRSVGASVQELWVCGGLEGYVLKSVQGS